MYVVDCPHPDCRGALRLAESLPAGEYACICRAVTVRLHWVGGCGEREPRLSVVAEPEGGS
jgi:hypothetical protein